VGPNAVIDELTRWTLEGIARRRAREREEDAVAAARKNLPDFSQYGTPVDEELRRYEAPKRSNTPSRELHCHTINLGDGDSATDCF
jgi:hypothetical protein